jgi:hypothetical protein
VIAPPPCAGEGGVSRSTALRRRSRPALQRGPREGLGERGPSFTRIRRILAKAQGQVVSRIGWPLRGHRCPSPPTLPPARGEGSLLAPPDTFIHTRQELMQIAFCLYKYFPYGGLQRDFLRIALACQARGHVIRVYTLEWRGDIPDGFEVLRVPVRALTNPRRYAKFSSWVGVDLAKNPGRPGRRVQQDAGPRRLFCCRPLL